MSIIQLIALVILLFVVLLTRGSPTTPLLALATSKLPAPRYRSLRLSDISRQPTGAERSSLQTSGRISPPARDRRSHPPERIRPMLNSAQTGRITSVRRPQRPSTAGRRTIWTPINGPTSAPLRSNATIATFAPFSEATPTPKAAITSVPVTALEQSPPVARPYTPFLPLRLDMKSASSDDLTMRSPTKKRTALAAIRNKLHFPPRRASIDAQIATSPSASAGRDGHAYAIPRMDRRNTAGTNGESEGHGWLSTSSDDGGDESADVENSFERTPLQPNIRLPPSPLPSDSEGQFSPKSHVA